MMAAAMNIVLGLLLLMMQATAAFTPHTTDEVDSCHCCACGAEGCAVPQSSPAPAPNPLATHRVAAESEVARLPAEKPVSMPAVRSANAFHTISFPSFVQVVVAPLYQQHCALLI